MLTRKCTKKDKVDKKNVFLITFSNRYDGSLKTEHVLSVSLINITSTIFQKFSSYLFKNYSSQIILIMPKEYISGGKFCSPDYEIW